MPKLGEMPLINDYSLCNQSVTVYTYDGDAVERVYCPRAYWERTEKVDIDQRGEHGTNEHLIVIPGNAVIPVVGCRVFLGEGPDVSGDDVAKWWRDFIPAKNDAVVVVRSVSPRHWRGEVVHVELRG